MPPSFPPAGPAHSSAGEGLGHEAVHARTGVGETPMDQRHDPTYAEVLHETFGPRVVGLQISRYGDGTTFERRPVNLVSLNSVPSKISPLEDS
jgi:hypothetical protein